MQAKHSTERQLKNVIALVRRRNRERQFEYEWANRGTPLPAGQKTPPEWTRNAIRHASRQLEEWRKELVSNPSFGGYLEALGAQLAVASLLETPSPSVRRAEEETPEIAKMREAVSRDVAKSLRSASDAQEKALKRMQKSLKAADALQIQANLARIHSGAQMLIDADGELAGSGLENQQFAQALWFWWPHLTHATNAREVRESLSEVGCEFSKEIVEKYCSKFSMFSGKRGRPRAKIIGR